MMGIGDKKKMVTVIMGRMGEMQKKPENDYGDEVSSEDGYMAASEEMMQATKNGDAKAFKHALKNFIEMCLDEEKKED